MQGQEPQPEQLVLVHEMTQVGAREALARRAGAILVERPLVPREPCVLEVEPSRARERRPGAPQPRRPDAVEDVDAALDHVEDARGIADAHEVARLVHRQQRRSPGRGLEHLSPLLPDGEAPERVAVEVELRELGDRPAAQLVVGVALRDPEHELAGRALGCTLPCRPQRRPAHGFLELAARDARRRNVVETHGDVRAELPLNLCRRLGR